MGCRCSSASWRRTLRWEHTDTPFAHHAIGDSATRHGRDLLGLGFTVSQVVHDYGDICQAITELAVEQNAPITTEEFHILNRCLDTAIADAVTEHARITAESRSADELERMGASVSSLLDMRTACTHAGHMSRMVQIRNVPEALHRKLKVRAADLGQTLSAYLLTELERLAARPTREEMLSRIHRRKRVILKTPASVVIREERESESA